MSALTERIAAEHHRVWNRLNITCLCGWDTAEPPRTQATFLAHIAEVTEAAVRAQAVEDIKDSTLGGHPYGEHDLGMLHAARIVGRTS